MPLLAGLGPLGVPELLIIAFIIVLIFGVGRLPEVGGAVWKGIREFRKAAQDDKDESALSSDAPAQAAPGPASPAAPAPSSAPAAPAAAASAGENASSDTRFCSECGARNMRSAKFCAECGNAMQAAAH